jgi:hypothetical protein
MRLAGARKSRISAAIEAEITKNPEILQIEINTKDRTNSIKSKP